MTTVNIGELCRLCVNPSYYHTNVFQTHSLDGNRLYETLNSTFQLNIVEGDSLPNYICMPCACKMSEIEVFKQNSQKGREKLLSFLKNKIISSEEDSEVKECNTTDTSGTTRCSGGEEIEIEEHPIVLKIEQVEEPNEGEFSEECGVEEGSIKVEIESPNKAIEWECDTSDFGGVSRFSGRESIGLEEHHAVIKMEQVIEPNEGVSTEEYGDEEDKAEFERPNKAIVHVSSIPDYLTVSEDRDSEAALQNQEHSVVDVQTVKGSLKMWNLERCEIPMIQKESYDKPNEEYAVIANGCSNINEENREECRIKETNMYKGRLRNKMRNIDENLPDQYSKTDGKDRRRMSTINACQKLSLGTKNPGDSIACSASNKAIKMKHVDRKTVGKPVSNSKGTNLLRNKSGSEMQNFFCDTCKKGFRFKNHLGVHVRIHNGVRPYECSICDKSFSQKGSLIVHNSVHTVGKPHVCTECGKSFKYKHNLRVHIKLHGKLHNITFPCVTCGKFFESVITLQEHLKTHGIVKPFSCKTCSKSFGSKRALVLHQKIHGDNRNKPFSCDTCKKSFNRKNHLDYHMYSHNNFKRHKCLICAKSFSLKHSLTRHMSCHSTEKPYKCPNCGKGFSRMGNLKHHMKFFCK